MNKLLNDFKEALTPEIQFVMSSDFASEVERGEYILAHPAKITVKQNIIESDGTVRWGKKD